MRKGSDEQSGNIEKRTKVIQYEYQPKKYIPYIPEDNNPKTPYNPQNPGKTQEDPNKPRNNVPTTLYDNGTPEDPKDNPNVPYIPGYTLYGPNDSIKPLVPINPNDPSEGYLPPESKDPTKNTPIPYVKEEEKCYCSLCRWTRKCHKETCERYTKFAVDTPYNKPIEINFNDKIYIFVKVKEGDVELDKVVKGTTNITYIYKLKNQPSMPDKPNPNKQDPNTPDSNKQDSQKPDPNKSVKPVNNIKQSKPEGVGDTSNTPNSNKLAKTDSKIEQTSFTLGV